MHCNLLRNGQPFSHEIPVRLDKRPGNRTRVDVTERIVDAINSVLLAHFGLVQLVVQVTCLNPGLFRTGHAELQATSRHRVLLFVVLLPSELPLGPATLIDSRTVHERSEVLWYTFEKQKKTDNTQIYPG